MSMPTVFGQSSYCSISPAHTMCSPPGPSSSCGKVFFRGLTQAEKLEALEQHNRLRSRVAVGSTNQPPAADMMELVWDDELARVAQRHADHCVFAHDCTNCRKVARFRVGQNIYRAKDYRQEAPQWRQVIDSWFSEISLFPGLGSIASYRYTPGTGHYTQMTWSSITSVGCGLITYKNADTGPFIARFYVCNYGPGGNFVGRKMYQPGRACSACPGSCSTSYPGLCSPTSFLTNEISQTKVTLNNDVFNFDIPVNNNIISNSVIVRPNTSLAIRREPRKDTSRFASRSGVPARVRPQRRPQSLPRRSRRPVSCRNILCTIARLFQ